jgi:hypothetical protein
MIFGDKDLRGEKMFRDLPWRSALKDLVLRGALSLIACGLAVLCVIGGLSALAANLGPKERSNYEDQAVPCKAGNCVAKATGTGHRVTNTKSEKRASQF